MRKTKPQMASSEDTMLDDMEVMEPKEQFETEESFPLGLEEDQLVGRTDNLAESDLRALMDWIESKDTVSRLPTRPVYPQVRSRRERPYAEPTTPLELASKFAHDCGRDWRYIPGDKDWYEWDAGWHECDKNTSVENAIRWYARDNYFQWKTIDKEGKEKQLAKDPQKGDGNTIAASASKVLSGLHPVTSERTRWNADSGLLGLQDGWCLDSRGKCVRTQRRDDHITKATAGVPTDYAGSRWEALIQHALPNELERRWFGCFLGQALLGRGLKEALFVPGETNTAKTTILNSILHAIQDYGTTVKADVLLVNKGGSFTLESSIASLEGVRVVGISESKELKKLDEYSLKTLVGNDELVGRKIGKDVVRFKPSFSVMFVMNAVPDLSEIDEASWGRLTFLPFDEEIPEDQQIPNYSTFLETPDEIGAILGWLIEHVVLYLERGMPPQSARMLEYKEEMRTETEDMSSVWQFINWACEDATGEHVFLGDLHEQYKESLHYGVEPIWGKTANIGMQRRALSKELKRLGFKIPEIRARDSEGTLQRYVSDLKWSMFN